MAIARAVRFLLTEGALYAANGGRGFDRRGVIAVSRAHLSTKGKWPPRQTFDCADGELIEAMREQRLAVYRQDPDQMRSDFNQEHETGVNYEGRCIWELLQNADDAMAPEGLSSDDLIGAKGLGFKSILEISDSASVFSGPFAFEFNARRSLELLRTISDDPPPLTFHLPHPAERDATVDRLLKQGFATVLRLPLRDDGVRKTINERLQGLKPHFLLLSRHLELVDIGFVDGTGRTLQREGPAGSDLSNARVKLRVRHDEQEETRAWRLWSRTWPAGPNGRKRLSAAFAVPVDGEVRTGEDDIPVHVFYPTRETIGAPFLVHAAFGLTANRNHIVPGDNDGRLIAALADMAAEAALAISPSAAVGLFADVVKAAPPNPRRIDRRLQKSIADAVSKSPFIPVAGGSVRVPPTQVRTWQYGLGDVLPAVSADLEKRRLADPSLTALFPQLQRAFDSKVLAALDYAEVLAATSFPNTEACAQAVAIAQAACFNTAAPNPGVVDRLALAAFWPTQDGRIRALSGQRPLVQSPPMDWPAWLDVDILASDFDIAPHPDGGIFLRTGWERLLATRLLTSREDWLIYALAPCVERWSEQDWADRGWSALAAVRRWLPDLDFRRIKPFIPGQTPPADPVRDRLAHVMKAPSRRQWVPTIDAYAGEEIQGPESLAGFFRERGDRPLIGHPKAALEVGSWRALLRYLGVSWEPKLRRFPTPPYAPSGIGTFLAETDPNLRYPSPDWRLEMFPECVAQSTSSSILKMLEALAPVVAHLPGRWAKVWGADRKHAPHPYGSFADWQLRRTRYLKCRPGLGSTVTRLAPHEAYWPDEGLRGVTPMLDLQKVDLSRRRSLRTLLVALGLNDRLPDDASKWRTWMAEVADASLKPGWALGLPTLRSFYDAALAKTFPVRAFNGVQVVCETADGLQAVSANKAIWIDQPDLAAAEVLDALRAAGQAIFPVQLSRGERIEALFGVRRASATVTIRPLHEAGPSRVTSLFEKRLRVRRKALAVTFDAKKQRWEEPAVRAVHGLVLEIGLGDVVLARRSVAAVQAVDHWLVNPDGDRWEALARACVGHLPPGLAADLRRRVAAVLRAKRHEVTAVLIEDGVPAYRLKEIVLDAEDDDDDVKNEAAGDADEIEANGSAEAVRPSTAGQSDEDEDEIDEDYGDENEPDEDDDFALGRDAGARPRLKPHPLYGGRGQGQDARGGQRKGRAAAAEAAERASARGLVAEAWFARAVEAGLPDDWDVQFNIRDDQLRESDVVLFGPDGQWHLEVKTLASERLYWSELERSKATALADRYYMAVLIGSPANGFFVHWLWNPLVDLAGLDRRLEWVWTAASEGPPLIRETWAPAPGLVEPQRPPDRKNHVIQVTDDFLEGLETSRRDLAPLWKRMRPDM